MKFAFHPKRQLLSTANDRNGIVSTYVSMGIISILSLISISFAALMQTEYTQARDRQFNTQARISAETAINDARQLIYKAIGDRLNLSQFIAEKDANGDGIIDTSEATITEIKFYDASKDGVVDLNDDILQKPYDTLLIEEWYDCGDSSVTRPGFEGNLDDAGSNIEYTCVEVDGRPVKLIYNNITTDRSENVLVQTRRLDGGVFSKSNVSELVISWQSLGVNDPRTFVEANTHKQKLHPRQSWGPTAPMLRVQIIPLNIRDGWTREELNQATRTYFLYPTKYNDPTTINSTISLYSTSPDEDGEIINADCDAGGELACTIKISGFNGSVGSYQINNAHEDIASRSDQYSCTTTSGVTTCAPPLPPGVTQCTTGIVGNPCLAGDDDEMVYIVLVRSIYGKAEVEISGKNSDLSCTPQPKCRELRFVNQQINVTATGRAGGLTYRLREVIPIRPKYNRPEYAIDSAEHICKVLIGEPDTGIKFDHGQIRGSYNNPINNEDVAFCESLHPV